LDELYNIYVLNLLVTLAMFLILTFRAWIEMRNYKIMWKELEWRKTREVAEKILRAEREMFTNVEGGQELYTLLCKMFQIPES